MITIILPTMYLKSFRVLQEDLILSKSYPLFVYLSIFIIRHVQST